MTSLRAVLVPLVLACAVASPASAANASLNGQLNLALRKLAQEILVVDARMLPGGKRLYTELDAKIDEKLSALGEVDRPRLVGTFKVKASRTHWDPKGGSLEFAVDFRVDRKTDRADLSFDGTLRTDLLALANAPEMQKETGMSGRAGTVRQLFENLAAAFDKELVEARADVAKLEAEAKTAAPTKRDADFRGERVKTAKEGVLGRERFAAEFKSALKANKDANRFDLKTTKPYTTRGDGKTTLLEIHATPHSLRLKAAATGARAGRDLPVSRETVKSLLVMQDGTAIGMQLLLGAATTAYVYSVAVLEPKKLKGP